MTYDDAEGKLGSLVDGASGALMPVPMKTSERFLEDFKRHVLEDAERMAMAPLPTRLVGLAESLDEGRLVSTAARALRQVGKTESMHWAAEHFLALLALRHLVPDRLPLWHFAMLGPRR